MFNYLVTDCCVEDESTGKEATGSTRETRRGTCQGAQRIAKEGTKPDTCIKRIPKSQRYRLKPMEINDINIQYIIIIITIKLRIYRYLYIYAICYILPFNY